MSQFAPKRPRGPVQRRDNAHRRTPPEECEARGGRSREGTFGWKSILVSTGEGGEGEFVLSRADSICLNKH